MNKKIPTLCYSLSGAICAGVLLLPAPVCAQADDSAGVSLTTLHSFDVNDGEEPSAELVEGSDGYFYGTTASGGTYGFHGTVFKIGSDGAFTSLHSFNGGDGNAPSGGLAEGRDGYFYGTTEGGSGGTVFKISSTGEFTSLHSFGGPDGVNPAAGLTRGSDDYFYGTTQLGGANLSGGSVFKISPDGTFTSLYSFTDENDGADPFGGLVQGGDGYFYGTTEFGGTSSRPNGFAGFGTVFKISGTGELTSLHSFTGRDGKGPVARLVEGRDGYFYGTTESGANSGYGFGTVFKISSTGEFTSLHSFTASVGSGENPVGGLVQGSDGYFYGTTELGGTNGGRGTVFKIGSDGTFTNLYSFSGGNDGEYPLAGLVQGSDGYFYGTTSTGGASGGGTVFRLVVPLKHRFHKPHGRYDHSDHE